VIQNNCFAISYDKAPDGLPNGLKPEIRGNYRIIEHSASKDVWMAYDVKNWKKQDSNKIIMYPPVYRYEYENKSGKWSVYVHEVPIDNVYREEFITVISTKKPLQKQNKETGKKAKNNLPPVPLVSKQAYYKLLKCYTPLLIPRNENENEQTRYIFNHYVDIYNKAGYSFEKSIIVWAKEYKKNPHFHSQNKYADTPARSMWADVHFFSDRLDEFPYNKLFSKEAYKALLNVQNVDKQLQGKKIE